MNKNGNPRTIRVWIARYPQGWQPRCWQDVPPQVIVLEPAAERCMAPHEAALFIEGFNCESMGSPRDNRWAIACAVDIRYEGDFCRGEFAPSEKMVRFPATERIAG